MPDITPSELGRTGTILRKCPDCGEHNTGYFLHNVDIWWWCKNCHVGFLLFPGGTFDHYGEQFGRKVQGEPHV